MLAEVDLLMSPLERLTRTGWGELLRRGLVVVTLAMVVIVGAVFTISAADEPVMLVVAAPILAAVVWMSLALWRVGVFGSQAGIVIQGIFGRALLTWESVTEARVEDAAVGLRPQRTVVIAVQDGQARHLYLWNERSLLMRGSPGGVDALAERINHAIAHHRT
jgi:hypothetical protein